MASLRGTQKNDMIPLKWTQEINKTCIYGGGIFLWEENQNYQQRQRYVFVNNI